MTTLRSTFPFERRRLAAAAFPLLIAAVLGAGLTAQPAGATRLVAVPTDAPGLTTLGLALDHSTREAGQVVFAATEDEVRLLERAGIPVETRIADLEGHYEARLLAERDLWEGRPRGTGFDLGSMGGYYTWDEVNGKLDEMRAAYPTLITARQSLGLSHEGRDVWMVKISDNADLAEGEPAILYTGVTHAREPMGMENLIYFMFHLLEGYGTDPEATYLVDERELFFVTVLNPDGYVYNQVTNPNGGGLWRKNRRVNGGGSFGVDLNRNYSYNWGYDDQGSSPNPSSNVYRGPSPFSEPETSAIRAFHQVETVWNAFHYHSYGQYEIHPFGHLANAFPPEPDRTLFLFYGGEISAMNGYTVGNAWQTVGYFVNGDAVDYSYGEQTEKNKVFAFTPEIGSQQDGFWPPSSRIVPLCEENLGPNLYYAWIAGARVYLFGVAAGPQVPAGGTAEVVVELSNLGLGGVADDVTLELTSADPYVTIAEPVKDFPSIPPLGVESNAADPLEFLVSGGAPQGHEITLEVTARQGPIVRVVTPVQVTVQGTTGLVADAGAPGAAGIRVSVRPNPVRGAGAEVALELGAAGPARVVVYDVTGRARRTLGGDGTMGAGLHRLAFDGLDDAGAALPSGVYVARAEGGADAGAATAEARLVVLR